MEASITLAGCDQETADRLLAREGMPPLDVGETSDAARGLEIPFRRNGGPEPIGISAVAISMRGEVVAGIEEPTILTHA